MLRLSSVVNVLYLRSAIGSFVYTKDENGSTVGMSSMKLSESRYMKNESSVQPSPIGVAYPKITSSVYGALIGRTIVLPAVFAAVVRARSAPVTGSKSESSVYRRPDAMLRAPLV